MEIASVTVWELGGASIGAIGPSPCREPSDAITPPSTPFSWAAAADLPPGAVGTMIRLMRGF